MNNDRKDIYIIIGIFLLLVGSFLVLVFINTANQSHQIVEAKPIAKQNHVLAKKQTPQYNAPQNDAPVIGTRTYKWTDKDGGMHFSERPPADKSIPYTTVMARTDLNVVQGVNPAEVFNDSGKATTQFPQNDALDATLQVHEQHCSVYQKGSIPYRDCRRQVHLILKDKCSKYRGSLNRASAEEYSGLKDEADRYCYAYEHFLVVD